MHINRLRPTKPQRRSRSPQDSHIYKVYILKCSDGRFYVGKTKNLDNRLERHRRGEVSFTASRLPFTLVTYIAFDDEWKAVQLQDFMLSYYQVFLVKKVFFN
ncbi:MAG: GIY-YIG nuclease family protein [Saprospiraceae bacterium]|nr:GIY-YIG nuclease family protein [Saprospiraceae bacterium]